MPLGANVWSWHESDLDGSLLDFRQTQVCRPTAYLDATAADVLSGLQALHYAFWPKMTEHWPLGHR
jgi:hypothetical protein